MEIKETGSSNEIAEGKTSDIDEISAEGEGCLEESDIPDDYLEQIDEDELKDGDIDIDSDDNGEVYMVNGELQPDTAYELGGVKYETNEFGNIISWNGEVKYTPENERDNKAQLEAGGDYRLEGDDGGHLVARINGGNDGVENMVPMRSTINRGDYKRSENEITEALKNSETVREHGSLKYEGESSRPSEITLEYEYGDVKKQLICDNVENSTILLDDIKSEVNVKDYKALSDKIKEMQDDGNDVSVTSVMREYDKNDNVETITVGYRNETEKEKYYYTFEVGQNRSDAK